MTTLWNPRKKLNQPPGYGQVNTVKGTPTSCPIAEGAALAALKEAQRGRSKRAGQWVLTMAGRGGND